MPAASEGLKGVMEIEMSGAVVTFKVAEPRMEPVLAVMVVVPDWLADATPEALMAATETVEELQVTEVVRFLVVPSVYWPVAVNCWVTPSETWALGGVTVIELRLGVGFGEGEELEPLPPQPTSVTKVPRTSPQKTAFRLTNASVQRRGTEQIGLLRIPLSFLEQKKHVRCHGACSKPKD